MATRVAASSPPAAALQARPSSPRASPTAVKSSLSFGDTPPPERAARRQRKETRRKERETKRNKRPRRDTWKEKTPKEKAKERRREAKRLARKNRASRNLLVCPLYGMLHFLVEVVTAQKQFHLYWRCIMQAFESKLFITGTRLTPNLCQAYHRQRAPSS